MDTDQLTYVMMMLIFFICVGTVASGTLVVLWAMKKLTRAGRK